MREREREWWRGESDTRVAATAQSSLPALLPLMPLSGGGRPKNQRSAPDSIPCRSLPSCHKRSSARAKFYHFQRGYVRVRRHGVAARLRRGRCWWRPSWRNAPTRSDIASRHLPPMPRLGRGCVWRGDSVSNRSRQSGCGATAASDEISQNDHRAVREVECD